MQGRGRVLVRVLVRVRVLKSLCLQIVWAHSCGTLSQQFRMADEDVRTKPKKITQLHPLGDNGLPDFENLDPEDLDDILAVIRLRDDKEKGKL